MADVENGKFKYLQLPEGSITDPEIARKSRIEADLKAQQNLRNFQDRLKEIGEEVYLGFASKTLRRYQAGEAKRYSQNRILPSTISPPLIKASWAGAGFFETARNRNRLLTAKWSHTAKDDYIENAYTNYDFETVFLPQNSSIWLDRAVVSRGYYQITPEQKNQGLLIGDLKHKDIVTLSFKSENLLSLGYHIESYSPSYTNNWQLGLQEKDFDEFWRKHRLFYSRFGNFDRSEYTRLDNEPIPTVSRYEYLYVDQYHYPGGVFRFKGATNILRGLVDPGNYTPINFDIIARLISGDLGRIWGADVEEYRKKDIVKHTYDPYQNQFMFRDSLEIGYKFEIQHKNSTRDYLELMQAYLNLIPGHQVER